MKGDRVLSMLGLAMRAGKIKSGSFQVEKAIDKGEGKLILFCTDSATRTLEMLKEKAEKKQIPVIFYGTMESLGHAIGKEDRSCIAVLDEGFSKTIAGYFTEAETKEQS